MTAPPPAAAAASMALLMLRVDRLAVAGGAESAHVEESGRGWNGYAFARCSSEGWKRSGGRGGEANAAQPQKVTTGGIKWSHGAGHATRADLSIGNSSYWKTRGQARSQYKWSARSFVPVAVSVARLFARFAFHPVLRQSRRLFEGHLSAKGFLINSRSNPRIVSRWSARGKSFVLLFSSLLLSGWPEPN